ncbi:MAG: hypothetical protein ACOX17_05750 [Christensenellales bacterium]|jgi:hypothetical protein
MATAAGTISGHSYWNSGWIPSGSSTYGATSSQTCYAGGSYPYVLKFTVPSVSGDLSAATLTFTLFAVKASASSATFNYRISTSGKDGSTNTVPSGLVSGSVTFSSITASGYQGSFTTAAVNLTAGGTYYLWLHGGTAFQAYKHASYYSVALNYTAYTACGAPTACSVSSTLAEGAVTLSWSGASGGIGNAITSYEIQYSESSDNSSWGSWAALTTVTTTATSGSISVSPSSTRGYFRRFQVRTRGAAGSSYYSGWKVSSNTVRKNTLPTVPTSFTASPATYNNENVTLSWSGAAAGTSAIKQYTIEHCTSTNGSTWTSWSALTIVTTSSTSGSKVVTPTTVAGTYTKYRLSVTDTLGAVSAAYKESNSIYAAITACGAPTACSVSATLTEGNVTLSWSGASSGAGNAISSYEIQYSESTDGSTWGGWTALTTVTTTSTTGSLSVSPSATRGNYRRFQVRTRGMAGSSYYSTWKATNNSVRKNTLPAAPTSFVASPIIYEINIITLTWSGAAAGTSAIKQYVIQQSTSADGAVWQAYETLVTISSSETFGNYETAASIVAGTYTRYRISVTDTLGAVSAFAVSGTVKKNSPPAALMVTAPKAGGATYNARPRFLITTGMEPDGQVQQVCIKIGADEWQDSVNNPERFSQGGYLGNGVKTVFRSETDLPTGSVTAVFKCVDEGIASSSPEVNCNFTVLASPFETITENETKVKVEHIRTIREAVNAVRGYYGLAAANWSENIIAGKTAIKNWPYHILEIRAALEGVITFINQFDTGTGFDVPEVDWLPLGTGRPRAAVMRQIQDLILTL